MSRVSRLVSGCGPRVPWTTRVLQRQPVRLPVGTHLARAIDRFHRATACRLLGHRWGDDTSYGQYPVHCTRCGEPDV